MSDNKKRIFFSMVLIGLILLLFRESFMGMLLQGVDDNISMRSVIVRSLLSKQGYHFIPNYWLGFIFNVPNPDLYNSILALTGNVQVVWIYIVALFLSGILTFTLIKRQGLSDSASVFGALSYTFLPHVLSLVYSGHALAIEAIPMTPGFLLCLSVILDGRTEKHIFKILATIWAGIFWAWMMIGEPQRGIYGTVLGMAWVLYLLIYTKSISFPISTLKEFLPIQTIKNKICYLFLVVIIGLGIFLPTIKFWSNSEFLANQGSWEFATSWSFPPVELLDSFAFGYHGLSSSEPEYPYYGDKPLSGNTDSLGFFLMVFMIIGAVLAWKKTDKSLRFFLFAGFLALLLAFGKYLPGTPFFWLWYQIPGMDKMRVPLKFLSITGLSWSIVAAFGLDAVKELLASSDVNDIKKKKIFFLVLGTIMGLSILWLILLMVTGGGDASVIRKALGRADRAMIDAILTGRLHAVLSMTSLFTMLTALCYLGGRYPRFLNYFPLIIILLTSYNLYQSNRFYIARTYVNEEKFYPKTELIRFLEDNLGLEYRASGSLYIPNLTGSPHPMGSVVEQGLYPLNNNDLTYSFPYFDLNMFGRIPISRLDDGYVNFFASPFNSIDNYQSYDDIWEMNRRLWYIGNVKYLLVGADNQQLFVSQLQKDALFITNLRGSYNQTVAIYELKNKLPRFALVSNVRETDRLDLFDSLSRSLKNIEQFVLPIENIGYGIPEDLTISPPVPVVPERLNYNAYRLDLNLSEAKVLYFGDLMDPGWKILVDSVPGRLDRANGIQQYTYIPEGTQSIELYYDRPVSGLLFSQIFIILAMIFAVVVALKNVRL
ncbi:MAG: hypothetical protein ACRCWI_04590 [Brevinema sp.]